MTTTVAAEALRRNAAVLLKKYRAGSWLPDPAECELVGELALDRWDACFLRAALRDGRLMDVLSPAADIMDRAGTTGAKDTVLQLRVLVDAITPRHRHGQDP